jgi:hypothetical protein
LNSLDDGQKLGVAATATSMPAQAMAKKRWQDHRGGPGGPHCFLPGTGIRTSDGEVRIEDLRVGDLVLTVRDEAKPIKWIGHHVYKKSGRSWHDSAMPIRVLRFAIDERTPHADLYLSPWHALLIDGYLMPAKDLVNGISVAPSIPASMEVLEYFHIVLDAHEVIWAEGAPAETLLVESRNFHENFTNFVDYERLYPNGNCCAMTPFAPNLACCGGRAELKALLRRGVSSVVDMRDPLQKAYDRIAARAQEVVA